MLRDYRDWLESELKLLGNASHHAYSFGQANMAQRAIQRLDEELRRTVYVALDKSEAASVLRAIKTTGAPELDVLREAIESALIAAQGAQ
ncbi:MAG: hypothetical protein NVS3B28_28200 [Candidatus Velthaea sp.]